MITRSRITRNVLMLMSGTAMAQIIVVVAMPFVTRLFTPEMFGALSLYQSLSQFFIPVVAWRYEGALLISEAEEESRALFFLGLIIVFFMAFFASIVTYGFFVFDFMGYAELPSWSPLFMAISLVGTGYFALYRSWLLRQGAVKGIGLAAISRSGSSAVSKVLAGFFSLGSYGLLLSEVVGAWAAVLSLRKKSKRLFKGEVGRWNLSSAKRMAKKYKKFAAYEMPSMLLNQVSAVAPVPIIASLYGIKAAGMFGVARMVFSIPSRQIGNAAADVFQMELGRLVRVNKVEQVEKLFYSFSGKLTIVALVLCLAFVFLAPLCVPYVFGVEWSAAGFMLAEMAPWICASLVVSAMSRALSVMEKQEWKIVYDISLLGIMALVYGYSKNQEFSSVDFVGVLSVGMALAYVIYFFVIAVVVHIDVKARCAESHG